MHKETGYKIVIGILAGIIILQWFYISKPKPKPRKPTATVAQAIKGKIAIVLDDWGYNLNNMPVLEQIKYPLTLSVLPNLSYSSAVARKLHAKGYEVILHLPMEPLERTRLEKNTIMVGASESVIKKIIDQDLSSLVYANGVSNHMGSRVTENTKTMEKVFKELKKRKLYFLDSYVSSKSVCSELAKKFGVGFARREIFLDNQEDPVYIRGQIRKLMNRAREKGAAIGIGHDRKVTLEVLREVMPQLEKEGYKFVFVSELVR